MIEVMDSCIDMTRPAGQPEPTASAPREWLLWCREVRGKRTRVFLHSISGNTLREARAALRRFCKGKKVVPNWEERRPPTPKV